MIHTTTILGVISLLIGIFFLWGYVDLNKELIRRKNGEDMSEEDEEDKEMAKKFDIPVELVRTNEQTIKIASYITGAFFIIGILLLMY